MVDCNMWLMMEWCKMQCCKMICCNGWLMMQCCKMQCCKMQCCNGWLMMECCNVFFLIWLRRTKKIPQKAKKNVCGLVGETLVQNKIYNSVGLYKCFCTKIEFCRPCWRQLVGDGFLCSTGWRRLIGSPKLHFIFHKRATKYRGLLRKMTCKDKGCYESWPPSMHLRVQALLLWVLATLYPPLSTSIERWGAGVETQKNVRGEIGGWGRVPFNETYAPSLSTIYDGA